MNRLKRILSLFLVTLSLIGWTVQAMPIDPSNITKVEIKVNGEGSATINDEDGYSKTIINQEVFKADCTLDTDLKLIATPNEGYYISSVDGIDSEGVSDGNSKVYDVDLKENKTSITINFLEEIKEETNEEVNQSNTNEEVKEDIPKEDDSSNKDEVKEEVNELEGLSEEAIIIEKYNRGIKQEKELIEARKKLAAEKSLLDKVDENFFLKPEYLSNKSSAELMEEGILILINSLSREEFEKIVTNELTLISNTLNIRESLIVGNRGAVTEYYQGYAHTAPMLSVDGKQAFCAMFQRPDPSGGTRAYNKRQVNNEMMRKILYYGYRGPGTGSISSNWSSNQNLLMIATTQATSKANGHRSYSVGNDFYNYVSTLPSPPSGFKVYMVSTGASTQDLAFWEMQQKGSLQISKESSEPSITNVNNYYSVVGAEYGVYSYASATRLLGKLTISSNGWSNTIDLDAGKVYLKELKAPPGFALDPKIYEVTVNAGVKTTRTFKDRPQTDPVGLLLRKVDKDTGNNIPQGNGSLKDAHFAFKFYAGKYDEGVNPADLGFSPTRSWILRTDENGMCMLNDSFKVSGDEFWYSSFGVPTLPLGTITIEEVKAPKGYKLNSEIFVRRITPNGSAENVNTYNEPIVKEDVLEFRIKKVQIGTVIPIPGAKFKHTRPNGNSSTLTVASNGEIVIRGLEHGVHKILEVEAAPGYEINRNEFVFEVMSDNTIRVITDTTNKGLAYSTFEGDGVLTVSDDVKQFKLKIVKVNDKGNFLPNTEFTLYSDRECRNELQKKLINENGELIFENIKVGVNYFFKETDAPPGYRIPVDENGNVHVYSLYVEAEPINNVFNFYVDGVKYTANATTGDIHLEGTKDDRIVSVKVVNQITMKLPATGSNLMIPIMIVGASLMLGALVWNRKNRKKDNR